ncbi:MAG: double-strand break repair protein AddB [Alphaproteobacteria bacterium]
MLQGCYNIPYGFNFADELAAGILKTYGHDYQLLASVTIFLPTARACRSVHEAFLRANDGKANIAPRLVPLGDPNADDVLLNMPDAPTIKPAISELKRRIHLTQLIGATKGVQAKAADEKISYDQAARISQTLGALLDDMAAYEVDIGAFTALTQGEYADHWKPILKFLDIIFTNWPHILADLGVQDAGNRRVQILDALCQAWAFNPPKTPIIAAAINRNIPSVRRFLEAIAGLENGSIVFQGFEHIDDDMWNLFTREDMDWHSQSTAESSPFWVNTQLLHAIHKKPEDIRPWPFLAINSQNQPEYSIADCLRPPGVKAIDFELKKLPFELVECENSSEEAKLIALMMRSQLEKNGQTAALITPNRDLAQKVQAELKRWHLDIDDSAGVALSKTPIGIYLCLINEMAAENIRPRSLVAFLKHPFTHLGKDRNQLRPLARKLDIYLREAGNIEGFALINQYLRKTQAQQFEDGNMDADLAILLDLLNQIELHIAPFTRLLSEVQAAPQEVLHHHIQFTEWAATGDIGLGADILWKGDAGQTASSFIAALLEELALLPIINGKRWPEFFTLFLDGQTIRPVRNTHPRLFIWGMVESRIQQADLTIIGGFNEGHWPQIPDTGPWLSRPMRKQLGMNGVEEEIGLNAADFMNLVSAPKVVITRPMREGSKPATKSRWLRRIEAKLPSDYKNNNQNIWHNWLHALYDIPQIPSLKPALRPAPTPPLTARPRKLSVTRIDNLLKDSYSIYVSHILKLYPLNDLESDLDAAAFGNLAHDILEEYIALMAQDVGVNQILDNRHLDILKDLAQTKLVALNLPKAQEGFWQRRLDNLCDWFFEQENKDRQKICKTWLEIRGEYTWASDYKPFTLTGRADRIDVLEDGTIRIIDYKTSSIIPTKKQVYNHQAPQMTLEALIAQKAGFPQFDAYQASSLEYWQISGSASAKPTQIPVEENIITDAENLLTYLVNYFDNPATPYWARPYGNAIKIYGTYDHLARYKEWSTSGENADE